jgi:hypothetical protein
VGSASGRMAKSATAVGALLRFLGAGEAMLCVYGWWEGRTCWRWWWWWWWCYAERSADLVEKFWQGSGVVVCNIFATGAPRAMGFAVTELGSLAL